MQISILKGLYDFDKFTLLLKIIYGTCNDFGTSYSRNLLAGKPNETTVDMVSTF